MARQFEDRVEIVGIASRDEPEAMADFVERHDLGHVRHAIDADAAVWASFGVPGQPAWVFVDGDTGELTRHIGMLEPAELEARVADLAR